MSELGKKTFGFFQKVPVAPTNPHDPKDVKRFDIKDLYADEDKPEMGEEALGLDEKLRQAYFWITNTAIISPFYDIEYDDGDSKRFVFGDSKVEVTLPTNQSYSSFVLIPLLTLAVRGKCLIVGGARSW